jgi:hypothetical protein
VDGGCGGQCKELAVIDSGVCAVFAERDIKGQKRWRGQEDEEGCGCLNCEIQMLEAAFSKGILSKFIAILNKEKCEKVVKAV